MADPAPPVLPRQVRRSRPGYGVLRGVGALVAGLMVAGAVATTVPDMVQQEAPVSGRLGTGSGLPEGADTVLVRSPFGDVTVVEVEDPAAAAVDADLSWTFTRPELRVEPDGAGRLVVSAPCEGANLGRCSAVFQVAVPRGTAVEVESTFGDVDLTTSGTVTVRATTGDVSVGGSPEQVEARSTAGDLRVLVGRAPQRVDLRSTFGNVEAVLPGDERYLVTASSTHGDADVRLSSDPSAERTVHVQSTFGDVRVTR